MDISTVELSLLVIAGIKGYEVAKSEGVKSLFAGIVGVGLAVIIVLLTR